MELYGCDAARFSPQYIRKFLHDLPPEIGMRRVGKPFVYKPPGSEEIIQGFVVLRESHACIYAWPEREFAYVHILSCKSFDKNKASKSISERFHAKKYRRITR